MKRGHLILVACVLVVAVISLIWYFQAAQRPTESAAPVVSSTSTEIPGASAAKRGARQSADNAPTEVSAHNLLLRKGPSFRVYVRWLRGEMVRARPKVNPSFDDPDSFFLDIKTGVLRANIGDINNFLNTSGLAHSPLKNVTITGDGNQMKLKGTLHKFVALPIELRGTISAVPDNRIQIHVTKLNVLKIPFKALLGGLHISVADLFHPQGIPGVQISGNDIFFDTQKLLPPPHIRGHLTSVSIVNPDLEEIYGNAQGDVARVEQWRNFLRLSDGTIDFGKLTMHHVDLIMIDISKDAWFDLDLANYQAQLVNGYTRMTPQAGLQIFMPDLRDIPPKAKEDIGIEWFRNRNMPPPVNVTPKRR